MKFTKTHLDGVVIINPKVYEDSRGFFLESFKREVFRRSGISDDFVQDNHSHSNKGVVRGLHYQIEPKSQCKLIRVIKGTIFDVAVDIRPKSQTYGKWVGEILSSQNKRMMYIADGFAHGFMALETSDVLYKVTEYYSPEHEKGIFWKDTQICIDWPRLDVGYIISERDKAYPGLANI